MPSMTLCLWLSTSYSIDHTCMRENAFSPRLSTLSMTNKLPFDFLLHPNCSRIFMAGGFHQNIDFYFSNGLRCGPFFGGRRGVAEGRGIFLWLYLLWFPSLPLLFLSLSWASSLFVSHPHAIWTLLVVNTLGVCLRWFGNQNTKMQAFFGSCSESSEGLDFFEQSQYIS